MDYSTNRLSSPVQSCLFSGLGAALRAVPRAVFSCRASCRSLGVDIFGHVDIIVQQHLLFGPSRGTGRRSYGVLVSTLSLRHLFQTSPAAAPAVCLQDPSSLGAAAAAVGREEGYDGRERKGKKMTQVKRKVNVMQLCMNNN